MKKIDFENLEKKKLFWKTFFFKILENRKFSGNFTWYFHLKKTFFFDFPDFRKFSCFSKKSFFFEIFKIDFLHDEKIFFTQNFLSFLIYISTDARNHLEHPGSELHTRISRNAKKSLFFVLIDIFRPPTWWILCVTDRPESFAIDCPEVFWTLSIGCAISRGNIDRS